MQEITPQSIARQAQPKFTTVTFKQFAALARQRSWTVESLAERFRGRIDNPAEFFQRVLSGKFPDNLIPYRFVIELYHAPQQNALPFDDDLTPNQRISTNPAPKVRQTSVNDFLEHV